MEKYNYLQIRKEIYKWSEKYLKEHSENFELTKDEEECLKFDLTFDNCLAQLTVCNESFAPYKNVSFEAATLDSEKAIESGEPELIFFFYDSDDMQIQEVLDYLSNGYLYCEKYVPDELDKKYTGKQGVILKQGKDCEKYIHPDDISKMQEINMQDTFMCVGYQFQYLILEKNEKRIRMLSDNFELV